MHNSKSKISHLLILASLLSLPLLASAQSDQYYLIGYQAPEGSISSGGQGKQVVYLRWDPVEGNLPADVVSIRLTRNGSVLLDKLVGEVMSPAEINLLYGGAAQERRLLEIILKLKQQAIDGGSDFVTSDFATVIWGLINPLQPSYDSFWAHLASRGDINVALARYRGFIDEPGSGPFDYELLAVDGVGATARLGFVTVDTTQPQSSIGASDFAQVATTQCDLPEYARDHYTVALSWDEQKAANITDQFAAQLYSGGYDLFRTTSNLDASVTVAPPRNIAQEAAVAGHDTRGVPRLNGLEMVNDVLLTVPADTSSTPEWVETIADLKRAGLKPGDRRGYYLVPRDFTGNYGPTAATIVVVPNLLRPAAPWELRATVDAVSPGLPAGFDPPSLSISWDDINLDNYVATYAGTRTFCNLRAAAATGVIEFVGEGEDCDVDTIRSVRVDVNEYVMYRFDNFETASRFKDSDGDGVADRDERATMQQCDAAVQPPGARNYRLNPLRVNLSEVVLPISGRETIRMQDAVPANPAFQGETVWYRVAAKTPDGMLSFLSAPQRGLVPNRDLPPPPIIEVRRTASQRNGCELIVDNPIGSWSLLDKIDQVDYTASCAGIKNPVTFNDEAANVFSQECANVRTNCNDVLTLSYPDDQGGELCRVNLPADLPAGNDTFSFCSTGQARLVPTFVTGTVPTTPGEVVVGPLTVTVARQIGAFPDVCLDLIENIGGDHARVASSCGTQTPGTITYVVESGFFCGYAVARDSNNNISPAAVAPCTLIAPNTAKVPTTPQPVSITANTNNIDFSWRAPVEPIAVTMVSIDHRRGDGSSDREFVSIPAAAAGSGDLSNYTASVAPLIGDSDEICVRFQAVGQTAVNGSSSNSGWSAVLCDTRRAVSSALPQYLPWPIVTAAVEGTPLDTGLQGTVSAPANGYFPYIDLGPIPDEKLLTQDCRGLVGPAFKDAVCNRRGEQSIRAIVEAAVPFVAYRQSRDVDGNVGNWIQVSPLIEFAHFDSVAADPMDPADRTREMNDPFIRLRGTPLEAANHRLAFVDRYPYPAGDYRYQFVYFDETHRITRWRRSDWISVPGIGQ